MMKTFCKIIFFINLLLILNQQLFCQSEKWEKYLAIESQLKDLWQTEEYDKIKDAYTELYSLNNKFIYLEDYNYYIECLKRLNDTSALKDIMFNVIECNWFDYEVLAHPSYDILRTVSYGALLDSLAKEKGQKNYPFIDTLTKMAAVDQEIRTGSLSALFPDSTLSIEEKKSMKIERMNYIDSVNTSALINLIDSFGFPTWKRVGYAGSYYAWLIAQHAKPEFQEWYAEQYKQAVIEDNAAPAYYGYLIDRIRIRKRIPQLYGTQFFSGSGNYHPIEDIENLNNRRESIHLPPINVNEITVLEHFPY